MAVKEGHFPLQICLVLAGKNIIFWIPIEALTRALQDLCGMRKRRRERG